MSARADPYDFPEARKTSKYSSKSPPDGKLFFCEKLENRNNVESIEIK